MPFHFTVQSATVRDLQVRKKLITVEVQTRYPTVLCLPPPLSWLEREDAALAG